MTFSDTTAYFLTVVAIALAPGPVVLLLMMRAASRDTLGAVLCAAGYATGGVIIITAVCFGLGGWLHAEPQVFEFGKYLMMAYIIYLARAIWTSGLETGDAEKIQSGGIVLSFCAGLMTCMISPYMMILFPLVLPNVVDINTLDGGTFALISVTTFAALGTGSGIVITFAGQLRRLAGSPSHTALINRSLATVLVAAGSYMALG